MRPIKTITIGEHLVDIITYITWGEKELLQSEFIKGAKIDGTGVQNFDPTVLLSAKYKLFEIAVKGIKKGEEVIVYSKEWLDNLTIDEGDKLYAEIDELNKKKA